MNSDSEYNWSVIALLLPAVAFSIISLDLFWSMAAISAIVFLFAPRIFGTRSLQFSLIVAMLLIFQPYALLRLLALDQGTTILILIVLQAGFVYFFSLALLMQARHKIGAQIGPHYVAFLSIMLSISLSTGLGLLSFFIDRVLSTNLLPNNTYLMLQLSASFFVSIILGAAFRPFIETKESSLEAEMCRPVRD